MSAFSGLCALGHLDLQFPRTYQISAGNTKTAAGHLLDGRTPVIIRTCGEKSFFTFAAFTAVGFSLQMVHGNGQCLMGLFGDGTVGHGTGLEALDDLCLALHFL